MSQEKKGSIKKLIFVDFILELKYIEKMVDLFIIVDAQGIFWGLFWRRSFVSMLNSVKLFKDLEENNIPK